MVNLKRLIRYGAFDAASAIKKPFSRRHRRKRMKEFVSRMRLSGGEKIIDLGGTIDFWKDLSIPLKITIVNLPGELKKIQNPTVHDIKFIEGDACLIDFAEDSSFDIAFSNSVIEHVGDEDRQAMMAKEVRRLAQKYWVQTPSIWFPVEAHNHMPFWWFYPKSLQEHFIKKWKNKLPAWTKMIEGTTVISRRKLQYFFPDAKIYTETSFGWTKSYVAYRCD